MIFSLAIRHGLLIKFILHLRIISPISLQHNFFFLVKFSIPFSLWFGSDFSTLTNSSVNSLRDFAWNILFERFFREGNIYRDIFLFIQLTRWMRYKSADERNPLDSNKLLALELSRTYHRCLSEQWTLFMWSGGDVCQLDTVSRLSHLISKGRRLDVDSSWFTTHHLAHSFSHLFSRNSRCMYSIRTWQIANLLEERWKLDKQSHSLSRSKAHADNISLLSSLGEKL